MSNAIKATVVLNTGARNLPLINWSKKMDLLKPSCHVLVVKKGEISQTLRNWLMASHYTYEIVETGEEAIAEYEAKERGYYQLFIVDYYLFDPVAVCEVFCTYLRKVKKDDTPIRVLCKKQDTAYAEDLFRELENIEIMEIDEFN